MSCSQGGELLTNSIRVGTSLSLSGRYRMQGKECRDGLRLWEESVNRNGGLAVGSEGTPRSVRLVCYDDKSQVDNVINNMKRLVHEDSVDCLFGPYGGLTIKAARWARNHGRLLWNHSGASDAVLREGRDHVVNILSPSSDYLRAVPELLYSSGVEPGCIHAVASNRGSFASQVLRGLKQASKSGGWTVEEWLFDPPLSDARPIIKRLVEEQARVVVGIGDFEDDCELVSHRTDLVPPMEVMVVIAAGVEAFGRECPGVCEGILGPCQWHPRDTSSHRAGPSTSTFCERFRHRFGREPDYPAAQAFACGLIWEQCAQKTDTLDTDALRRTAHSLRTSTFFGTFQLDSKGRQVGHRVRLVQWQQGNRRLIWPGEHAEIDPEFPLDGGNRSP